MNKEKNDSVNLFMNFCIVVLVLVAVAVGLILYETKKRDNDRFSFSRDAHMLEFEIKNSAYADLIMGKYINEFEGKEQALYYSALADYVEALSKYKVYSAKGYDERAKEQRDIMIRSRKDMGNLTVYADLADDMFEQ